MTLAEEPPPPALPAEPATIAPAKSPNWKLSPESLELLVVMGITYFPSLLVNITLLLPHPDVTGSYTPVAMLLYYLPRMIQLALPVIYIGSIRGRPMSGLGLVRPRWRDGLAGLGMFVGAYIAAGVVVYGLYFALFSGSAGNGETNFRAAFPSASSLVDVLLIGAVSIVVGFAEELFFRAYLITQLLRIQRSMIVAVAISTTLFGLNHLYQGPLGVVSAAILGLCYALYFIRFKRIWPIAVAHALTDFVGLLAAHAGK